jgi:class 3 adenylate cyclase/predicted ATPase
MHRVVPELIIENYRAGNYGGEFPAVGMFLDLSGFSKMTDTLMQHGQHGAEVLAYLMHGVFDPLVKSIFDYGGRIVGFAGDGIMALYPVDGDEHFTALQALASAWTIQQQLFDDPDRTTVYGKFSFSVKIGLAAGSVGWRILRSEDGSQATYYFRGSTVDLAARAEHNAGAGEIVLTDAMNELIKDVARTRPHGSFHRFIRFGGGMLGPTPYTLAPVDVACSRVFMPEDVIVHDMRGEFRQIVNLFARIPELSDEQLEQFMGVVFKLRQKYGGLLTRLDFGDKGCNMLMLWGAPVAYENDISRALNFILELQEKMDFPVTAGITYYIAHAGYLGSEMCEDYTCYGWGVNLASRFMMAAPTGEIWLDERVERRVSEWFDIDTVGSQHFKGFAAEQKVNVLHGRRQDVDAIYQGEMVGRQMELDQLTEFVEPIWQGRFAGAVAVSGDAGIGKGRLIYAFSTSDLFKVNKALWVVCQSDQILRQSFNPLRRWLLRYFGLSPRQTPDERQHALDSKLDNLLASLPDPELVRELDRTRSILGALVDVYWDDSLYSQLDAEARYNNTFIALIALIKAESLRQPLVLFVDDVHFIDEDTRTFLSQLKRSLLAASDSYPVAIILAFRKQGIRSSLQDDLHDSEIELTGISKVETSHLAEILLGASASPELIGLVMSRSEGNPFFAQQVIRYLQEESLLEMSSSGWAQVRRGRSSVLPGDISALLVARLDQLKQDVKNVVQTASVLGREFEVNVLAHMLGPVHDTELYVSEAEKAAIWMPLQEMRYIFHHGLLRDAAYTMQMRVRRQELHSRAVDALEHVYAGDLPMRYAELAYHSEHADLAAKAQEYYTLAGRDSSELFRNREALEYYTRALSYVPFDDLRTQFDVRLERVVLYNRLGERTAQLHDLESLEKLAIQLQDDRLVAKVWMQYASYYYFVGDYRNSIEYAKRAEVDPTDENELALYTQVVWCSSLLRLGQLDEAMQRARGTLERDKKAGNRKEESRVLNMMGLIALEQKESSSAGAYFMEALEIARDIKDRDLESKALNNLAMAEGSLNGNYALAREYHLQSYILTREIGDRPGEAVSLGNLGFAASMQGDFSSARTYYEQSLVTAREVGNLYQEIYTLINLSALAGVLKEAEPALQNAKQAVELAHKTSDLSGEAWAMLYMGHAYLLQNELEQAQVAYRSSIEIRSNLEQTALSMEPLAGLVEATIRAGDLESASIPAEKIFNFLESGATLDGTDEPLRVYYTCYRFLEKKKDPRAGQILQKAKELLETQVSKFSNDAERKRYIENIPWRRAVRDATTATLESR